MPTSSKADERTLFRHRARLFTMTAGNAWAESGSGDAKLLLHVGTNRTRLVMRKDKTMSILLNQLVQPDATLNSAQSETDDRSGASDRAFIFEAEDFATGVMRRETFAIRFKAEPSALEFKQKYTEAQERNRLVFAAEQAGLQSPAAAVNAAAAAAAAASLAATTTLPASVARVQNNRASYANSLTSPPPATIYEESGEDQTDRTPVEAGKLGLEANGSQSPLRMSALSASAAAAAAVPVAGSPPRSSQSARAGVVAPAGPGATSHSASLALSAAVGDEGAVEVEAGQGAQEEGGEAQGVPAGTGSSGWRLVGVAALVLVVGAAACGVALYRDPTLVRQARAAGKTLAESLRERVGELSSQVRASVEASVKR